MISKGELSELDKIAIFSFARGGGIIVDKIAR
jgi:hypothetical protein